MLQHTAGEPQPTGTTGLGTGGLGLGQRILPWMLVLLTGCAGYQIGNQTLYPAHIRTVYVPMIESSSFRRNLGERLTEAVVKEIERTTPYKVLGTPNADSVLSARIVGETKRVLIQGRSGDPREAVVKEIERTTPYKVLGTPNADSVLSARIVGETKRVLIQGRSGDPREFETNLQVQVQWLDRQGQVLRAAEPIPLPPELVNVGASGSLIPEVGQSVATSHQQAITRLAEQIVGLMENPW